MSLVPIGVAVACFSLTLISFFFLTHSYLRQLSRQQFLMLAALFVAGVTLKLPNFHAPFHGLEYEDCFVYQSAARLMDAHLAHLPALGSFLTEAPAIGSISGDPGTESIYNYVGWPAVILLAHRVFGYAPLVAHLVSVSLVSICLIGVFVLTLVVSRDLRVAFASSIAFSAVPLLNVYASETSAEPLSGFAVLASALAFTSFLDDDEGSWRRLAPLWIFSVAALSMTILAKRENCLLIIMLPIGAILSQRQAGGSLKKYVAKSLLVCLPVLAFVLLVLGMGQNMAGESHPLADDLFSLTNALRMGPSFLLAMLTWNQHLLFGALAAIGLASAFHKREARLPAVLLVAYLGIYSLHYRGYYACTVPSTWLPTQWASRYSVTFMPFLAMLAGVGVWSLFERVARLHAFASIRCGTRLCIALIVAVLALSWHYTMRLRADLTRDEQANRVIPVRRTIELMGRVAPRATWILTSEPHLFYIYGGRDLNICNLVALDVAGKWLRGQRVLVVEPGMGFDRIIRNRFAPQFAELDARRARLVYADTGLRLSVVDSW